MNFDKYVRPEPEGISIYDREDELTSLPEDFFDAYKQIQSLTIYGTGLTSLPSSFTRLDNLRHLRLSGTKIKNLPDETASLKSLRFFGVNSNSFDLGKEATKLLSIE